MRTACWFVVASLVTACSSSSFDVASAADSAAEDGTIADATGTDGTNPEDTTSADAPIAPESGMTEASTPDAPPDSMIKCGDMSTFPKFDKGCTADINCAYGLHQVDCCGSKIAIGFNHAYKDAFDKAELAWETACPAACDCLAKPTLAEDGKTGAMFGVQCKSGVCTSVAK